MTEGIIIAIVTGVFAVLGQYIISQRARREDEIKRAVLDERTANRLQTIEHKLDIHNGYAEKLGDIQKDIAALRVKVEEIEK